MVQTKRRVALYAMAQQAVALGREVAEATRAVNLGRGAAERALPTAAWLRSKTESRSRPAIRRRSMP